MNQIGTGKTLCVVLHYGDEAETWQCLESIVDYDFLDIVIADNDPSQKIKLPEPYKNKANIFRTGGQAGFAEANNMAVNWGRGTTHNSVLLLNNDTVVLDGALNRLRHLLDGKNVGAVGPCMPYLSHPGRIWACGGYINKFRVRIGPLRKIKSSEPYVVDYLPGAAILCKLTVWDKAGGLPEKYFLAYEEAEFAINIKKLDFAIMVDPKAKILHKVGMSSEHRNEYTYNAIRNRLKFGKCLRGNLIGFSLAAFMTFLPLVRKRSFKKIEIWSRSVMDELHNVPLDKQMLNKVKLEFEEDGAAP